MEEIHRILQAIQLAKPKSVLATILHVQGSAYRKAGTSMLFQDDGTQVGLLSAGCLEADLAARATEWFERPNIWSNGCSRTLVYDMSAEDDLSWGQGAGCNGVVHVLMETVTPHLRDDLIRVKRHLDTGVPVLMVKRLSKDFTVTDSLFVTADGQRFGKWRGEIADSFQRFLEHTFKQEQKSGVFHLADNQNRESSTETPLFLHRLLPKPRLILFGAGPDAQPLAAFATQSGFSVTLADWRPAACNAANFPQADGLLLGPPLATLEKLALTAQDSVVIMTHNFQRDKELLQRLQRQELRYLGILGPRQRTSRLLDGADIPEWLHAPVGLAIGAEGPEEIAISILADVIQARKKPYVKQVASKSIKW